MNQMVPFPHHERILWIPGRIIGLNEIIEYHAIRGGGGKWAWNKYNQAKRKFGQKLALLARDQGFPPFDGGHFSYRFVEADKRRDPSNFVGGGVKLIEDALQEAGLLKGDGWNSVWSFTVSWEVGEFPGVEVHVLGTEWKESKDERERKGRRKFQRNPVRSRAEGDQGLPKLARKNRPANARKASALPARKHRSRDE